MIEVVRAGALTTVQDLGRVGLAHLGVPRSGAVDPPALARANALVGNPPDAAGLEVTLTGCRLRFTASARVAVAGAAARLRVGGVVAESPVVDVPAGADLDLGPARGGVRTYLAVAGGIDVPPVLGSRSTDTLSGLGPAPLRDGDAVPVGAVRGAPRAMPAPPERVDRPVRLRFHPGPRADWFVGPFGGTYTVSMASNRIAARLDGPALTRAVDGELPSEGLVLGAVQVPAGGQPLVFLADHPTTGGYPVVAVVDADDLPALAQCRPGTAVRFVPWT